MRVDATAFMHVFQVIYDCVGLHTLGFVLRPTLPHPVLHTLRIPSSLPISMRPQDGWTPLHRAANNGHTAVVVLLSGTGRTEAKTSVSQTYPKQACSEYDLAVGEEDTVRHGANVVSPI
jgi:ankyrin repeat protein